VGKDRRANLPAVSNRREVFACTPAAALRDLRSLTETLLLHPQPAGAAAQGRWRRWQPDRPATCTRGCKQAAPGRAAQPEQPRAEPSSGDRPIWLDFEPVALEPLYRQFLVFDFFGASFGDGIAEDGQTTSLVMARE
jgi:hypothetical protein